MQRVLTFLEMFRRDRRPGDLVFAIGFFVFAVLTVALLPSQARWVSGTPTVAQPAFWPLVGALMMLGFGAIHLTGTWMSPRLAGRLKEVLFWVRSLEYVAWFVAYVLAVPRLGYLPASLLFALALTFRLGYRRGRDFAVAALFALVVVLVFKAGLNVKIPAGALYEHLPAGLRSFVMTNF